MYRETRGPLGRQIAIVWKVLSGEVMFSSEAYCGPFNGNILLMGLCAIASDVNMPLNGTILFDGNTPKYGNISMNENMPLKGHCTIPFNGNMRLYENMSSYVSE